MGLATALQQLLPDRKLIADTDGYTLHATSKLVVLDVVVTDASGRVVNDLAQKDFDVLENKETQKVTSFERPALHVSPANVTIHSTLELDRFAPQTPVNIVVLDEFNSTFNEISFARSSLKKYLSQQREKLDQPTMLVAVALGHFDVLQDYTQDKRAIERALDHHLAENPWQSKQLSWSSDQYGTAFAALIQLAEASSGHPGHKNLLWVGRGFPQINPGDLPADKLKGLESTVQFCVNMLRDARVTLYAVDPAGLPAGSPLLRTYGSVPGTPGVPPPPVDLYGRYLDDTTVGHFQFDELARATGGRALHGHNDVDAEIGRSLYEGSNFYTLSYIPTDTSRSSTKYRKVEVLLKRPGLTVTTRRGYYVQPPPPPENIAKPSERVEFDLQSAANSRMIYDAVPVTATLRKGAEDIYVAHIAGSALGPAAGFAPGAPIDLAFVTDLYDKRERILKRNARTIRQVSNASLVQDGLNIEVDLKATPGAARARFVLRIMQSGKIGTADLMLDGSTN